MNRVDFLLKNLEQGKLLDIGNIGNPYIHKRIISEAENSEVYGLDLDNQKNHNLNFKNQFQGNVENMPFENDFFDTIYAGQIIEHTWNPKKLTDEAYRVLKPGGVFILDTPNIYALSRMVRYFIKGKDVITGSPGHKIFWSRDMMENILQKSNFKHIKTRSDNKCTIKSKNFKLPSNGPFRNMGEHLLAIGRK